VSRDELRLACKFELALVGSLISNQLGFPGDLLFQAVDFRLVF